MAKNSISICTHCREYLKIRFYLNHNGINQITDYTKQYSMFIIIQN